MSHEKLRFPSGVECYNIILITNTDNVFNFIYSPYYKNSYYIMYNWKKKCYNTLFSSSTFVIEITSPVPDETSLHAAEGPTRNGGHPAEPGLFLGILNL